MIKLDLLGFTLSACLTPATASAAPQPVKTAHPRGAKLSRQVSGDTLYYIIIN